MYSFRDQDDGNTTKDIFTDIFLDEWNLIAFYNTGYLEQTSHRSLVREYRIALLYW